MLFVLNLQLNGCMLYLLLRKRCAMISENKIGNDFDFSMELLRLENNGKNKIFSPLSIFYALKMLSEGANGRTKEQVDSIIENFDVKKYYNIDSVLSLVNAVYIRDTYANCIKEDYKDKLNEKYDACIFYDPFANAINVNNWISNKTFGIIQNMISDNMVQNKSVKMLLINALAIDMKWNCFFDAINTSGSDFYLEDGSSMDATTMLTKDIPYYMDETVTAVALDLEKYDDVQLEFIAIMPKENLTDYIKTFSKTDFDTIIYNLTYSNSFSPVHLFIPRFSFDYQLKLKDDLVHLGITDAFDYHSADLSNMYDVDNADDRLFFNEALHKSKIDFTEKGIKAASVTVLSVKETASFRKQEQPIKIYINKPFLYFIKDKVTNQILFAGTVYKPNSWTDDKKSYQFTS